MQWKTMAASALLGAFLLTGCGGGTNPANATANVTNDGGVTAETNVTKNENSDQKAASASENIIAEVESRHSDKTYAEGELGLNQKLVDEMVDTYSAFDPAADDYYQASMEAVYNLAKELETAGLVTDVKMGRYNVKMTFPGDHIYLYSPQIEGTKTSPDADPNDPRFTAFTLEVFRSEFAANNRSRADMTDECGGFVDELDRYTWEYNLDDKEITYDTLDLFGPNQVIIWDGHGGYDEDLGGYLILSYDLWDYLSDNLPDDDYKLYNNGFLVIDSNDIDHNVGNMDNSFVYLSTCLCGKDDRLANAFLNKGADVVVASTDIIHIDYCNVVMWALFIEMFNGEPLENGLQGAKKYARGDCDPVPLEENDPREEQARVVYFGNGKHCFDKSPLPVSQDSAGEHIIAEFSPDKNVKISDYDYPVFYSANIQDGQLTIDGYLGYDFNENTDVICGGISDQGIHTFPVSSDVAIYVNLDWGREDLSIDHFNNMFKEHSMDCPGFGFVLTIQDGVVTEIRQWGA